MINKKFKNPLFLFSYNITDKIANIIENKENSNLFIDNKDNLIKIVYYALILVITVILYHFTIYKSFFEDTNVLRSISYIFMILIMIIFTNIIALMINKLHNIELTNERKKISKLIYLLLVYTL